MNFNDSFAQSYKKIINDRNMRYTVFWSSTVLSIAGNMVCMTRKVTSYAYIVYNAQFKYIIKFCVNNY